MSSLLPNAKQQFFSQIGLPLAGGKVYFYVPGTTTPKATYQDEALTIPNTNPITLDAGGRCIAWGSGDYRQVVYDRFGILIWDQITSDSSTALNAAITQLRADLADTTNPANGDAMIGVAQPGGGAPRTQHDINAQNIFLNDYKFTADGADWGPALRRAVAYAKTLASCVINIGTPGTTGLVYTLNSIDTSGRIPFVSTIPSNVRFQGHGYPTLLLGPGMNLKDTSVPPLNGCQIFWADTQDECFNVEFNGICFDLGGTTNLTSTQRQRTNAIGFFDGCYNLRIINNIFQNGPGSQYVTFGGGIGNAHGGAYNVTIRDNRFKDYGLDIVGARSDWDYSIIYVYGTNFKIEDNDFYSNTSYNFTAVDIPRGYNIKVRGNTFTKQWRGTFTNNVYTHSENIEISGNTYYETIFIAQQLSDGPAANKTRGVRIFDNDFLYDLATITDPNSFVTNPAPSIVDMSATAASTNQTLQDIYIYNNRCVRRNTSRSTFFTPAIRLGFFTDAFIEGNYVEGFCGPMIYYDQTNAFGRMTVRGNKSNNNYSTTTLPGQNKSCGLVCGMAKIAYMEVTENVLYNQGDFTNAWAVYFDLGSYAPIMVFTDNIVPTSFYMPIWCGTADTTFFGSLHIAGGYTIKQSGQDRLQNGFAYSGESFRSQDAPLSWFCSSQNRWNKNTQVASLAAYQAITPTVPAVVGDTLTVNTPTASGIYQYICTTAGTNATATFKALTTVAA